MNQHFINSYFYRVFPRYRYLRTESKEPMQNFSQPPLVSAATPTPTALTASFGLKKVSSEDASVDHIDSAKSWAFNMLDKGVFYWNSHTVN